MSCFLSILLAGMIYGGGHYFAAVVLLAVWREFGLWYTGVAVAHLIAYPWYAGEASDFKWFRGLS